MDIYPLRAAKRDARPESGGNVPLLSIGSVVQRARVEESSAPRCANEFAIADDHFPP
jgi:hypothetical protein